ncbi:putative alanyl-tRNA synthetase [Myriangium duriaei CBS 260.36]|uniref:Alanyl-tRNA synthetase n=1 Tax=Myriangium duriaei CBS 260.36 TaxID=1168546 RepID=A0A9P4MCE7_9PEZI|nr:putative alanyl-tRNA synthetase [Myriangium duriaei CBS 260.36]
MTEAVYQTHQWLGKMETKVVSCQELSTLSENERVLAAKLPDDYSALITEKTILYAKGGGQPSDTGLIRLGQVESRPLDISPPKDGFNVVLVRKADDERIMHFGNFHGDHSSLSPGQTVTQMIDCDKRIKHSRLHSAGHVLGLAVHLLEPTLGKLKEIKANHAPGEAALELEGSIAGEHKALIQAKVDEIVKKDMPIRIHLWSPEVFESKAGVTAPDTDSTGLLRVCEIDGQDYSPCGGTHVPSTFMTGPIVVKKISRSKGTTRISYDVLEFPNEHFSWADKSQ